jgi:hypothetical protein
MFVFAGTSAASGAAVFFGGKGLPPFFLLMIAKPIQNSSKYQPSFVFNATTPYLYFMNSIYVSK